MITVHAPVVPETSPLISTRSAPRTELEPPSTHPMLTTPVSVPSEDITAATHFLRRSPGPTSTTARVTDKDRTINNDFTTTSDAAHLQSVCHPFGPRTDRIDAEHVSTAAHTKRNDTPPVSKQETLGNSSTKGKSHVIDPQFLLVYITCVLIRMLSILIPPGWPFRQLIRLLFTFAAILMLPIPAAHAGPPPDLPLHLRRPGVSPNGEKLEDVIDIGPESRDRCSPPQSMFSSFVYLK
ncbi:hypothetical protein QR680_018443 [Steinernema hermaphroditum]|uniref:Uncharacterized protein n=1 Tax=Steinernema hermaphroditum TaxID=289476 RepID=A0AA39HHZ2_9BILA|nr:hypothetical protein QR680_018443 [Steinernema hermaphroditum]